MPHLMFLSVYCNALFTISLIEAAAALLECRLTIDPVSHYYDFYADYPFQLSLKGHRKENRK